MDGEPCTDVCHRGRSEMGTSVLGRGAQWLLGERAWETCGLQVPPAPLHRAALLDGAQTALF
jgi:hypothetical protein